MAGERAAIRYAKAVLGLASDLKTADTVNKDMGLIASTITKNKELSEMLQSPVIPSSAKKTVLLQVFKGSNATTLGLIDTLISNNRIDILNKVALKYGQLFDESKNIELATVTTAIPLTADLEKLVLAKTKELTEKKVELKNIVDESILGGFILRIGDVQYNASVTNQLNKLKREFTTN